MATDVGVDVYLFLVNEIRILLGIGRGPGENFPFQEGEQEKIISLLPLDPGCDLCNYCKDFVTIRGICLRKKLLQSIKMEGRGKEDGSVMTSLNCSGTRPETCPLSPLSFLAMGDSFS